MYLLFRDVTCTYVGVPELLYGNMAHGEYEIFLHHANVHNARVDSMSGSCVTTNHDCRRLVVRWQCWTTRTFRHESA